MPKLSVKRSLTSKITRVYIQKISDGRPMTGLTFASSGLQAWYIPEGAATAIRINPLVTATVGTWVTGGFVEVDATNLPGLYELHLPNLALASGGSVAGMLKGVTDMLECPFEIQLDAIDAQDAVRMGLTALPNVAAGANGGLPTGNASGQVAVASLANNAITAASIQTDAIDADALAADGTAEIATAVRTNLGTELGRLDAAISSRLATAGYTVPDNADIVSILGFVDTEVAAIKAKTDNLPGSPAATGGLVTLTLGQAIPNGQVAGTVGYALEAAESDGSGKWVLSPDGLTLTCYRADNVTVFRTFTLDAAPPDTTSRT